MNRTQEVQSEEYVYLQLRNGRARMHAHETSKDNTDIPLQQSTTRQMTGRIMQLTGAVRPELMLSLQLSETWDDHHPAGKGSKELCAS